MISLVFNNCFIFEEQEEEGDVQLESLKKNKDF